MADPGPNYRGWHYDPTNDRLDVYYGTTRMGHFNDCGMTLATALTASGGATVACGLTVTGATAIQLPSGCGCALESGTLGVECVSCTLHVTFTPD